MAKRYRQEDFTENRIGDWIDNNRLCTLNSAEEDMAREKEINIQKLLENHKEIEKIYRNGIFQLIHSMKEQKNEFEAKLVAERKRHEKEIQKINAQIAELTHKNDVLSERVKELVLELNKINQERIHNAQIAVKYHQLAVAKYQEVVSDVKCIKFAKEKIDRLYDLLKRLDSPELSLEAQQAISITILADINEIKHHSEREYSRFIPKYELLVNCTDAFISSLNETCFLENNEKSAIDINHWTNNLFSELRANAETFRTHVESGKDAIDYLIPQIKEDEEFLKRLIEQKDLLITQAKSRALRSHKVIELGKRIQKTIVEKEKFDKQFFKFENNDDRGILVVELVREFDKKKLTFLFFQDSNMPFSPLCIVRQGSYIDASEYREFSNEIYELLKGIDIVVSFPNAKLNLSRYEEETFVSGRSQICNNIHKIIDSTFKKHFYYE